MQTTRDLLNYGPNFYDTGVATINPPVMTPSYQNNPANAPIYPTYVPITDSDGNELPGIRLPDVRAPLNTYTGWALRSAANGLNDGCEGSGQRIPLPTTKAARMASGDPRLSIEGRYPTFLDYYFKVTQAVNDFVAERFLLREDAQTMSNRMLNDGVATGAIHVSEEDEE